MHFVAKVFVPPKQAILDPEGKAVASSLHALGYDEVADVRLGKYVVVRLDASSPDRARSRVQEMCARLLANEIIEDFSFEIEEAAVA